MKLLANIHTKIYKNTQSTTLPPNIILTNSCNQKCSYCFAAKNMASNSRKEMSLKDFLFLISLYKKNGIKEIRLLGGEPTSHSHFQDILNISLQNFKKTWIFTNGIIPKQVVNYLNQTQNRKLTFVFNLDTVAFFSNPKLHQEIISNISLFGQFAQIYTGFTLSNLTKDYLGLFNNFTQSTLHSMSVRFGIAKPMLGQKPFFDSSSQTELTEVGNKIVSTVKGLHQLNVRAVTLDCGLDPLMFGESDLSYLQTHTNIKGWGCLGYWGGFDIDTDLTIIPCFPHSQTLPRKSLADFTNIQEIRSFYTCKQSCLLKFEV